MRVSATSAPRGATQSADRKHSHHPRDSDDMVGMASYYGKEFGPSIGVGRAHQSKCLDSCSSLAAVRH